eukprot:ctg_683.g255
MMAERSSTGYRPALATACALCSNCVTVGSNPSTSLAGTAGAAVLSEKMMITFRNYVRAFYFQRGCLRSARSPSESRSRRQMLATHFVSPSVVVPLSEPSLGEIVQRKAPETAAGGDRAQPRATPAAQAAAAGNRHAAVPGVGAERVHSGHAEHACGAPDRHHQDARAGHRPVLHAAAGAAVSWGHLQHLERGTECCHLPGRVRGAEKRVSATARPGRLADADAEQAAAAGPERQFPGCAARHFPDARQPPGDPRQLAGGAGARCALRRAADRLLRAAEDLAGAEPADARRQRSAAGCGGGRAGRLRGGHSHHAGRCGGDHALHPKPAVVSGDAELYGGPEHRAPYPR